MMSICRVFSCVVGRGCLLWPVRSLGKTLLAFALIHSVLQGQICLLLQVFLDFLLLHSSPPIMKRTSFLDVSSKMVEVQSLTVKKTICPEPCNHPGGQREARGSATSPSHVTDTRSLWVTCERLLSEASSPLLPGAVMLFLLKFN